jgi:protein gp37
VKPYNQQELEQIISNHYPEFTGIHPSANLFPLPDEEDYSRLVESMHNGLIESLSRTPEGLLLDGRSRLMACYDTNTEIRVTTVNHPDYILWSIGKNLDRRHLTAVQKAFIGEKALKLYEDEAKERQIESKLGNQNAIKTTVEIFPQLNEPSIESSSALVDYFSKSTKARDQAGNSVGVSGKYVGMARNVEQFAPELKEQVITGDISLTEANKEALVIKKAFKEIKEPVTKHQSTVITVDGRSALMDSSDTPVFNKTNENVEWAGYTWNPVTGCNHGCNFCYARAITHNGQMERNYPFKFEPAFYEYRLAAPVNTKLPKDLTNPANGRVFVGSMADLFGKWVPDDWITKVFDACMTNPEWEYLFLTKWPKRYKLLESLPKAWFGASVIQQSDVKRVEKEMQSFNTVGIKWISLEPMLEPITFNDLSWCNLVVIGAQTQTNQPTGNVPAFAPQFDWVVDVVNQCRQAGVAYYLKPNLLTSPGMALPKMNPSIN